MFVCVKLLSYLRFHSFSQVETEGREKSDEEDGNNKIDEIVASGTSEKKPRKRENNNNVDNSSLSPVPATVSLTTMKQEALITRETGTDL